MGSAVNTIHLIDFGLARRFRSAQTHIHIPYCDNHPFIGTARYASINALSGVELSRRDDLESLAYVLIYFLRGSLPWQGIRGGTKKRQLQVLEMKMSISPEALCEGLPSQFKTFLIYARALGFSQKPDYHYLRNLFCASDDTTVNFISNNISPEQCSVFGQDSSKTDCALPGVRKWK